jgi:hypothetical protein
MHFDDLTNANDIEKRQMENRIAEMERILEMQRELREEIKRQEEEREREREQMARLEAAYTLANMSEGRK